MLTTRYLYSYTDPNTGEVRIQTTSHRPLQDHLDGLSDDLREVVEHDGLVVTITEELYL